MEPLSNENIAVGSAVVNLGWSIATTAAHLPMEVTLAGVSALGSVSIWQAVKAKLEKRRER